MIALCAWFALSRFGVSPTSEPTHAEGNLSVVEVSSAQLVHAIRVVHSGLSVESAAMVGRRLRVHAEDHRRAPAVCGLIPLVVIRFKDVVTQRVNRGYKLTSNHTRFGSSLITPQRSDNCFTSQRPQPPTPSGEDSGRSDGSKPGPSSAISTRMRRPER